MRSLTLAAVGAAILFAGAAVEPASAALITEDFTVTTGGPLAGTYQGSFAYNSSIVIDSGTASGAGLLTDLNFTFDGTTFTAATANTAGYIGFLSWDSSGNLVGASFGACGSSPPCVTINTNTWAVDDNLFLYSTPTFANEEGGRVTFAPAAAAVPEPGTLALFGGGLVGLMGLLLRRPRKAIAA